MVKFAFYVTYCVECDDNEYDNPDNEVRDDYYAYWKHIDKLGPKIEAAIKAVPMVIGLEAVDDPPYQIDDNYC